MFFPEKDRCHVPNINIYIYIHRYIVPSIAEKDTFPNVYYIHPFPWGWNWDELAVISPIQRDFLDIFLDPQWYHCRSYHHSYGGFIMGNPIKIRMIWGYPYFRKPPYPINMRNPVHTSVIRNYSVWCFDSFCCCCANWLIMKSPCSKSNVLPVTVVDPVPHLHRIHSEGRNGWYSIMELLK